jgi:putative tryptophan/tyrosine transport system substrate-binding protein
VAYHGAKEEALAEGLSLSSVVPGLRAAHAGCRAVRDSTLVACYRSLYAPRTGGAYDSHHRTAGIAGRSRRRCGGVAARGARAAGGEAADYRVPGCGDAFVPSKSVTAFVQRLRELGWIENRTVAIEYRWAEGRDERFAEIADEFIRLKVDVIVTSGVAALVVKQATSVIPIVFAVAADPLGTGLVASLARPGGNVTGLSTQFADTGSKRLEILREAAPGLRRLAIIGNVGYPASVLEMSEAQAAARTFGLEVATLEIRRAEDIAPAFEALKDRVEALYICGDALTATNRNRIYTFALSARLPTIIGSREQVEGGGFISYGPNFVDLYRRSADYVDKILRGAKPADLPVEQPTKFDLVINLVTARALGLTVPPALLARADEVIE